MLDSIVVTKLWQKFRLPSGLLRRDAAASRLGIGVRKLVHWSERGCPLLDGHNLTTKFVDGPTEFQIRAWIASELDKVRRLMTECPRDASYDGAYSVKKTIEVTGLSAKTLRSKKKRKELGLEVVKRLVRTGSGRFKHVPAFTQRSVDRLIPVSSKELTVTEAMKTLGLDRTTIVDLLNRGLLKGTPDQRLLAAQNQSGWLVDPDSVSEASRLIRAHGKSRLAFHLRNPQVAHVPNGKRTVSRASKEIGVTRGTVRQWIIDKLLRAEKADGVPHAGNSGSETSYLIDAQDVDAASALVRKHGCSRGKSHQVREGLKKITSERKSSSPDALPTNSDGDTVRVPRKPGRSIDLNALKRRHFCWSLQHNGLVLRQIMSRVKEKFPGSGCPASEANVSQNITDFEKSFAKAAAGDRNWLHAFAQVGIDVQFLKTQFSPQK